jgi:tRNA (adenine57-N1/adenine58-N1)-methyltransferase
LKLQEPVLLKGNGKLFFVKAGDGDLHTDAGVFKLNTLLDMDWGDVITSHLGFELKLQRPRAPDLYHFLKRTGAPLSPKDIGMIISYTGLNKNDNVLDAGTGSGILAIYLGLIARRVVTYEVREEFTRIARNNITLAGLDNVEVRFGDIIQNIYTLNETFDLVTLDMNPAAEVIPGIIKVLNTGGYCVVFSPFIEQAREVYIAMKDAGFEDAVTFEFTQREISFSQRGTRPSTTRVGHTGYIAFSRKP